MFRWFRRKRGINLADLPKAWRDILKPLDPEEERRRLEFQAREHRRMLEYQAQAHYELLEYQAREMDALRRWHKALGAQRGANTSQTTEKCGQPNKLI